ncbi:MAG TPA: C1 family peptidase [Amycolatopsis sp.]|uniref:C1 family peptidase n=1 Tax=Amycolatopsis sp. TaxID=37632 RepID=UPI002B49F12E|nr:C1 family peptidase [Amycolatopsis sp.]HKS48832.1 C1 family peptidase [Amycolatopsis sp.]
MKPSITWLADLRGGLPPIGNQGQRGTCLAWAATTAHQHRRSSSLSVEYLHWACGPPPRGRGTRPGLRHALRTAGQPTTDQWPYDPSVDETAATYHPPRTVCGPFSTADARSVTHDPLSLAAQLNSGHLPIAALRITPAFLTARGGIIHDNHRGTDGHAVTVVGIARSEQPVGTVPAGELVVCVRNSWGPTWGRNGYALITETAWSACVMYAVMVRPSEEMSRA